MMSFVDQWLVCADCGKQFLWDVGEQVWFASKKLTHPPTHCKVCRDRRRDERHQQPRQFSKVNCERCGSETYVPFVPQGTKPIYCRMCFNQERR